jgi:hypothetical protein
MGPILTKLKAMPDALNQFFERFEASLRTVYRVTMVIAAFQIAAAVSHSQIPSMQGVATQLSEVTRSLDSIRKAIILK